MELFPLIRPGDHVLINIPINMKLSSRDLQDMYPDVTFKVIWVHVDHAPKVVFAYRPSPEPKPRPEGVVPLKDKLKFDKNG